MNNLKSFAIEIDRDLKKIKFKETNNKKFRGEWKKVR